MTYTSQQEFLAYMKETFGPKKDKDSKSVLEIYEALRLQNEERARAPLKTSAKIEEISDEVQPDLGQVDHVFPSAEPPIAHKMQDEEHEPESMKDKRSELTSDGKKQSSKPKGIFSRVLYAIYNFFKRLINKIGNRFSKIFSRSPAKSQDDLVVRAADLYNGQDSLALEIYNPNNLGDGQNSERNLKIS